MRKEDVQSKLDIIPENVEKLEIFKAMDYEKFASDFRNIDSALHRFQTSIQALVDIAGYIIASLGLRTPSTSAEVIDILVESGLLNEEQRDRYISMIQFRNRIVHFYPPSQKATGFKTVDECEGGYPTKLVWSVVGYASEGSALRSMWRAMGSSPWGSTTTSN